MNKIKASCVQKLDILSYIVSVFVFFISKLTFFYFSQNVEQDLGGAVDQIELLNITQTFLKNKFRKNDLRERENREEWKERGKDEKHE